MRNLVVCLLNEWRESEDAAIVLAASFLCEISISGGRRWHKVAAQEVIWYIEWATVGEVKRSRCGYLQNWRYYGSSTRCGGKVFQRRSQDALEVVLISIICRTCGITQADVYTSEITSSLSCSTFVTWEKLPLPEFATSSLLVWNSKQAEKCRAAWRQRIQFVVEFWCRENE